MCKIRRKTQRCERSLCCYSQVKLKAEDVKLIIAELEVSKDVAEKPLRQHNGDIVAALRQLVH
jgi:NACalpha-BTF3-like transcription factor